MPYRSFSSYNLSRPAYWKLFLHLPRLIRLVARLLKDRRVPFLGKLSFALALAYVLWPMDLIPELLIPVIGSLDDLAVLIVGVRILLFFTPRTVLEEHLTEISFPPNR
jgi:uncharacterized membrane protein YkvA (DUF1232 family)